MKGNEHKRTDGKKRIEDRLASFADVLVDVAKDIKESRARAAEWKRNWAEEERRKQEAARLWPKRKSGSSCLNVWCHLGSLPVQFGGLSTPFEKRQLDGEDLSNQEAHSNSGFSGPSDMQPRLIRSLPSLCFTFRKISGNVGPLAGFPGLLETPYDFLQHGTGELAGS